MNKQLTVPGGGEYVDADWSPHDQMFMVATIQQPDRLVLFDVPDDQGLIPLAWMHLGRWGLDLRYSVDDGGFGCAVMQDGRDPKPDGTFWPAIVCIFNGTDKVFEVAGAPPAFGDGSVEVVGLESGWWVFVMVNNMTFFRGRLERDGAWSVYETFPVPQVEGTSQGFTQGYRDGRIRFLDHWRATTPGLACPNDDGGLAVGQNGDDGPDRLLGADGAVRFVVYRGTAYEPHVVRGVDGWLATARTPAGPAVVLLRPPWLAEAPPQPEPQPDPIPDPDPKPEEPTVSIPNLSRVVNGISAEHPHLLAANNRESMTELLWRIADELYRFHDERFGLLSKSAGENGTVIAGIRVGVDALAYQGSDECVDIFGSVGDGAGKGSLTWDVKPRRESNTWVKPPARIGIPVPNLPPPGPPDPQQEDEDPDVMQIVPILLRIAAATEATAARLESLEAAINDKSNQVVGKIDELQRDVQRLVR